MNARRALVGLAAATLLCACSSSGSGKAAPSAGPSAGPSASPSATKSAAPAIVAARASAGCASKGVKADAPGERTIPFAAAGDTGLYVRHLPPSYDGRTPLPLVLDLHGYSETAAIQVAVSALGTFGDTHRFITLTPQTNAPVPLWNTDLKGKDVAFLGALLDTAEQTLCIDQARVFVTGYSNGAFMTSALACAFSSRIAAVAPIAGIQDISGCTFQRPVPVVAFHGTADPFVPYNGGIGPAALKLPAPDGSGKTLGQLGAAKQKPGPSVPQATTAWAKRNGCSTTPTDHTVASDVTLISYACPTDATTLLYRVTGGGHAWPGSPVDKALSKLIGPVTFSINANDVMWRFFMAHPLRQS
jgi:polyhydroxybutyrate depolymerase